MTEWQPIKTAPKDGACIQARIPGHGADNMICWVNGLVDSENNVCGGWMFAEPQEPPQCWTDGFCWEVIEDGVASVKPTDWRPHPSQDRREG